MQRRSGRSQHYGTHGRVDLMATDPRADAEPRLAFAAAAEGGKGQARYYNGEWQLE
jgi:hypothetical protein